MTGDNRRRWGSQNFHWLVRRLWESVKLFIPNMKYIHIHRIPAGEQEGQVSSQEKKKISTR